MSRAMLSILPQPSGLWPQLKGLLEGRRVVIYNADFDTRILLVEADRYFMRAAPAPRELLAIPDRPGRRRFHPEAIAWKNSLWAECAMEMVRPETSPTDTKVSMRTRPPHSPIEAADPNQRRRS